MPLIDSPLRVAICMLWPFLFSQKGSSLADTASRDKRTFLFLTYLHTYTEQCSNTRERVREKKQEAAKITFPVVIIGYLQRHSKHIHVTSVISWMCCVYLWTTDIAMLLQHSDKKMIYSWSPTIQLHEIWSLHSTHPWGAMGNHRSRDQIQMSGQHHD